jgi:hypothetical protein
VLGPVESNERFVPRAGTPEHWECDVLFGPVDQRSGTGAYYGGCGLEVSANVVDTVDDVSVSSLAFRGGTPAWILGVCRALVPACGPLVAVDSSYGLPALVTDQSDRAVFTAALQGDDAVQPGIGTL